MNFKKRRLNKALEEKVYRVKLVHGKKGWITVGLTFVTLFSATVFGAKSVDASAVNNVATANSTTSGYVKLYSDITKSSIHLTNRGLQNGTDWKTAKAVVGTDGEIYILVGGNEYANARDMDLKDETSSQELSGTVHVSDMQYAQLYTNPLDGAKLITNRALSGNSDWRTNSKVIVNGTTYYRVATNEWVKGANATLTSENSRSEKKYIENGPDAEDTNTTTDTNTDNNSNLNSNSGSHNNGGSANPDKDEKVTVTINYFKQSTTGNDHILLKTEKRQVKIGDNIATNLPTFEGYTVLPDSDNPLYSTVSFDGEVFNIGYTKNDAETPYAFVKYVDEKGNDIKISKVLNNQKVGDKISEDAPEIDGYELVSEPTQNLTVGADNAKNGIMFTYKAKETTPTDPSTDPNKIVTITINYLKRSTTTNDSKILSTETRQVKLGSTVTINAPEFEGYTVVAGEETSQNLVQFDGETFNIPYTQN